MPTQNEIGYQGVRGEAIPRPNAQGLGAPVGASGRDPCVKSGGGVVGTKRKIIRVGDGSWFKKIGKKKVERERKDIARLGLSN